MRTRPTDKASVRFIRGLRLLILSLLCLALATPPEVPPWACTVAYLGAASAFSAGILSMLGSVLALPLHERME